MTRPVVATIGVFDGVHRGHAALLARARARAREAMAGLTVITFDVSPQAVLSGADPYPRLTVLGEKAARLREEGAEEVRVLAFNRRLAAKSPERFLADHLFAFDRVAGLVLGYDFALGRGRRGTVEYLARLGERLGFAVEGVEAVLEGGEPVSSTRVRRLVASGRVEEAAVLLGRPYRLGGTVVRGDGRGRGLGFPTANLDLPPAKQRPAHGVYAVRAHVPRTGLSGAAGVLNVGVRPTFGDPRETVELHLLEGGRELVGLRVEADLLHRIRPERKFPGPKELAAQIGADADRARELLHAPPPPEMEP